MSGWIDGWWQLLERRERVVGMNRRNLDLVYPNNPRQAYPLADDKLLTKTLLGERGVDVPRVLAVCDGLYAVDRILDALDDHDDFVLKPARGSGGEGLMVLGERLAAGRWRLAGGREVTRDDLRMHIANIVFGTFSKDRPDVAFAEERIHPHPVHAALWSDGLCDLRLITLHGRPVLAMLRVPTAESEGKANLHQGGLGLAVDLESGRTTGAKRRGVRLTHHPDNGAPLLGLQLPSWPRTLEIAAALGDLPLQYLGVDIVVDATGRALVLEINARPGLEIQNVNDIGLAEAVARARQ